MPLRVFHQGCGRIKSHGLIVQHRRGKRRQVMAFQIRAGIREQRKTGGMRFRKSVQRKRSDRLHNAILRLVMNSILRHAHPQFSLHFFHPFLGPLRPKRPPQFFRFAPRKTRGNHCNAQQLLLKQRHTQRPLQHFF